MTATIYRSADGERAIRAWCEARLSAWPVPHERRTVTAHGAKTHVTIAGRGATTVVIAPGTNFNAATCLPLATALSRRYRTVIVDVPGQPGLSDGDRNVANGQLRWYGTWLEDVANATTAGPVVLLGHSFGGAIVLSSHPARLAGRVLVSTGGLCRLRLTPPTLIAAAAWGMWPRPATSARLLRRMLAPGHIPPPELIEWMTLVAHHARSSGAPGLAPPPTDGAPIVAAVGEHDTFLPPQRLDPAITTKLGIPLRVVAGSGHLVIEEEPTLVADLVNQVAGPIAKSDQ